MCVCVEIAQTYTRHASYISAALVYIVITKTGLMPYEKIPRPRYMCHMDVGVEYNIARLVEGREQRGITER